MLGRARAWPRHCRLVIDKGSEILQLHMVVVLVAPQRCGAVIWPNAVEQKWCNAASASQGKHPRCAGHFWSQCLGPRAQAPAHVHDPAAAGGAVSADGAPGPGEPLGYLHPVSPSMRRSLVVSAKMPLACLQQPAAMRQYPSTPTSSCPDRGPQLCCRASSSTCTSSPTCSRPSTVTASSGTWR